jgi:hypothetical protein
VKEMAMEANAVKEKAQGKPEKFVEVELTTIDPESGEQADEEREVEKGKTEVSLLKQELGIPAELALWVITKRGGGHGDRTRLADHDTYNVHKDDHFVVLRPGGVS